MRNCSILGSTRLNDVKVNWDHRPTPVENQRAACRAKSQRKVLRRPKHTCLWVVAPPGDGFNLCFNPKSTTPSRFPLHEAINQLIRFKKTTPPASNKWLFDTLCYWHLSASTGYASSPPSLFRRKAEVAEKFLLRPVASQPPAVDSVSTAVIGSTSHHLDHLPAIMFFYFYSYKQFSWIWANSPYQPPSIYLSIYLYIYIYYRYIYIYIYQQWWDLCEVCSGLPRTRKNYQQQGPGRHNNQAITNVQQVRP